MKSCIVSVLGILFALGATNRPGLAADHVAKLDLAQRLASDKVQIRTLEDGVCEWSLPDGAGQTLTIDLKASGIDPKQFDELRFDLKPVGSQVGLHVVLLGHPEDKLKSSWYLKFKAPAEEWSSGRFDLQLDDDGLYSGEVKDPAEAGKLKISLYRRILGYPGEPVWRKALFRNVRLVKRLVSAEFQLLETEIVQDAGEVSYTYPLHLRNNTEQAQKAWLELDSAGTLRHFRASAAETEFKLQPGEKKTVPVRLFMPLTKAKALPPLYSEPLIPRISVPGVEESDVIPLKGYRRWPMWAAVPVFFPCRWDPPTFQAFLDARQKAFPAVQGWKDGVGGAAEAAMKYRWPIPDFGPPGHDQGYRCNDCKCWLQPVTPVSLHHHQCPKCKKEFQNNAFFDRAWLMRYNSGRAHAVRSLALAWLITGKTAYAEKAAEILLDYAEAYPRMPIVGTRSTSGGSKLGGSTLHSSYVVPVFAEGYGYLSPAPCLDEDKRARIVGLLKGMGNDVMQHSVEYNNQQAEHLRAYGSVGLATGFWPMAAEAISGEFGYHEVAEFGYSEDGIAHEGGAYHRSVFSAMNLFATFAYGFGVNLYTPRLKRVFDGSLLAGASSAASYELAYQVYRDAQYLPTLAQERQGASETTILYGVAGLPKVEDLPAQSVLMPGAGYVFLKKGTAADWLGISLNYIKQFDRHERDRFTTFFHRTGNQADSTVGRITYGSPHCGWMSATAGHNTIVIDGGDQDEREGRLVAFDPSAQTPLAVVATSPETPFYEGVAQVRGIALVEGFFVVFDRVECDKPHTIDRYQYGKAPASLKFQTAKIEPLPGCLPKLGNFTQMEGGKCGKEIRIDFKNGLKMRLVSDGDMEAYKGLTIGGYQADPMEFTFARRPDCKQATFLAAFSLGDQAEPPTLKIIKAEAKELAFELSAQEKAWLLTVFPDEKKAAISAK
jgi:hypothetical protein